MAMDHAMPARGAASAYCSSDIGTGRSSGPLAAHPLLPCLPLSSTRLPENAPPSERSAFPLDALADHD